MKRMITAIIAGAVMALVGGGAGVADDGPRIFISADMEGIAAAVTEQQLGPGGFEYGRFREIMTDEVLAAIAGARAGGAGEIVVADSHGNMQNILVERLPADIRLIRGGNRPLSMMEGIQEGHFDGAIYIGYHASASNTAGVRAHTATWMLSAPAFRKALEQAPIVAPVVITSSMRRTRWPVILPRTLNASPAAHLRAAAVNRFEDARVPTRRRKQLSSGNPRRRATGRAISRPGLNPRRNVAHGWEGTGTATVRPAAIPSISSTRASCSPRGPSSSGLPASFALKRNDLARRS